MAPHDLTPPARVAAPPRFLPILLMLFLGSGCAALIYEVVWLQLLQLVIGSTAVSLGVLLGTFMGGMCLGSLLLPRLVSAGRHPLRVYAALEVGIGSIGLAVLFGMPYVELVYTRYAGHGPLGILLRGAVAGVCLLPPTLLLGATLPAIARWVETGPEGVSWLGFFYGGNIAGAVFGCLLAGFYLLRVYDMATATYVAFALNITVAAIALALAAVPAGRVVPIAIARAAGSARGGRLGRTSGNRSLRDVGAGRRGGLDPSALAGLGRHRLHLLVDPGRVPDRPGDRQQRRSIPGAAGQVGAAGPGRLPVAPDRGHRLDRHDDLGVASLLADRPQTVAEPLVHLSGRPGALPLGRPAASVPVGSELPAGARGCRVPRPGPGAAGRRGLCGQHGRRHRGRPGVQPAPGPLDRHRRRRTHADRTRRGGRARRLLAPLAAGAPKARLGGAAALLASLGVAGWLAWNVTPVPWVIVAFGRNTASWLAHAAPGIVNDAPSGSGLPDFFCTYIGEGTNVSVAVTVTREGVRNFHGAGKVQASTDPTDMRLQRMLGHIPALLHKKPESVLVVACGAGITAGTFVLHPDVKRVVICDIEPLVPTVVTPMFGNENYHVVDGIARENPHTVNGKQVEVVYDDGRHFLRTTQERFDIITSDPIDPWVKGCAAMNTVEYYRMCRDHLNPGGIVCLWIPLYESNLDTAKSVIATFFEVFPHGILWSNEREGQGYDAVLFGQVEPTVIDVDELEERLDRADHRLVTQSLREVGFGEIKEVNPGEVGEVEEGIDLLATYLGQAPFLKEWSRGAQINTDRNLRLQYLAGMWLNSDMGERIRSSILAYYRFPDDTFVGSPETVSALQQALEHDGRGEPGNAPSAAK